MSEDLQKTERPSGMGWPFVFLLLGTGLLSVGIGVALIGLKLGGETAPTAPDGGDLSAVNTLLAHDNPSTADPFAVPSATPSVTIAGPVILEREPVVETPTTTPEAAGTATVPPPEFIEWTQEEINALSWLCRGEVGGMGSVRGDACLSVISTVRARYAYSNGFGTTDVISTILAPNQFHITIDTSQPAPDAALYDLVIAYQNGARGSCNGYLYFDSVPGGPVLCTIRSSNGQFLEFHNGWR